MPRPPRVQVAGGIFHVTARGNRQQLIYADDADRQLFLSLLERVVARCGWRCHAYCLMSNHFHLVIETPQPNLSYGLQLLNGAYAQCFNHRHGLSGHLFQGRFHSVLVETSDQFLQLVRYVVLNPVRAGLCERPEDWPWSSYRAFLARISPPRFLAVDLLLAELGQDPDRARAVLQDLVCDRRG
jgi:putative transposase